MPWKMSRKFLAKCLEIIGRQSILQNSTRILVTNALHLLPQCHRIYVIDNGEIIETGNYQKLSTGTRNGCYSANKIVS